MSSVDSKIKFAAAPAVGLIVPSVRPLHIDEMVWSLYEQDELTYDGKRLVRVQVVRVNRGGRLTEFRRTLGPSSAFAAEPFAIMVLDTESVGRIMDKAEKYRHHNGLQKAMDDHLAEGDVVQAAIQRAEMTKEFIKRNRRTVEHLR